ncbi:MAG TPA: DUF4349 domain-containing protein [Acidimicrobiales bacterium]|nr:DUF4349 domain-containing protein [Acidimicrobiales bacterium]
MRRTWGVALLVLVLTGVGCSGGEDDTSSAGDSGAGGDDAAATAFDRDDASTAARASSETAGLESSVELEDTMPQLGAKVVRTAELRIEVEKGTFGRQLRAASALARTLGGFVQSSSTTSFEEGDASGEITLRVPVDRYDEAMEQLGKIGSVESSAEEGEDVTDQLIDLGARVRALRAEEDALNALMADAANVNEVLAVRSTAVSIRQQIEQLAAQQASLEDRSSFSTIHVVLHEATASLASADEDDDWSIAQAFDTAGDVAVRVVGSMIVVVGVVLPLLPFAAVALLIARRRRVATEG